MRSNASERGQGSGWPNMLAIIKIQDTYSFLYKRISSVHQEVLSINSEHIDHPRRKLLISSHREDPSLSRAQLILGRAMTLVPKVRKN